MLSLARTILIIGIILVILGGVLYLAARFMPFLNRFPLGRLPGDIHIQRGNSTCVIALGSSIFLSIFLTILLNLIARLLNR